MGLGAKYGMIDHRLQSGFRKLCFVDKRCNILHMENRLNEQCLPQVIMTWDCVTATVLTYTVKHVNYSTYCRDQLLSHRQGQRWGRNKHTR